MHKKMFFIASLLILWISSIFLYVGTPSLPPDLKEVFISVQGAIPLIPFATIDAPGQLTQHEKNYFNAANNHRNSTPLGGGNGLVTKKFTSSGTGNSFEDFLYMTGGFPGTSAAIPF